MSLHDTNILVDTTSLHNRFSDTIIRRKSDNNVIIIRFRIQICDGILIITLHGMIEKFLIISN